MRELLCDGVRAALIDLRHRDIALKMLRAFHAPEGPRPDSRAVYDEIEIGAPCSSIPRL